MRILIISQYFWPENFRINDLAAGMVERGHEVTVLTGQPNYPYGKYFEGYGWRKPREEHYAGAQVFRVPLIPRGAGGWLRLALNYLSFVVSASLGVFLRLPSGKAFDVVFVFQPSPVTVGIPATLARWRYQAPMLFWILDLWPDSLAAVGAVRSSWLLRVIDRLVEWIYRRCDLVLVQSTAFISQVVNHGIPEQLVRYFPNWGEAVFSNAPRPEITLPMEKTAPFRLLFAGNIGAAQDFPAIIEAAALLRGRTDIHWVIVGDGRMAEWAKAEVARQGLATTVFFLGQHPLESMPAFFDDADVLLVSLRRDPIFSITVPGKLQSYLASGKPVLAMLDGEGAKIVAESGAGLHCPAGESAALAQALEKFAEMSPAERLAMGARGLEYFEKHFARERVFDHLEEWLKELLEDHEKG